MTARSPIVLLFLATTAALSPQRQESLPEGAKVKADLVYAQGGGRPLRLDLFLPVSGEGPFPAVVYIHGGAWRSGDKSHFWPQAAHMAREGFVGACIEYRLSREAKFPAAVKDAKAAIRWLRANASRYHIDPAKIGVAGESAGGHLAAMLGTTSHIPAFEGDGGNASYSSQVQAVAAFNPVSDLVSFGKRMSGSGREQRNPIYRFLGVTYRDDPKLWANASPLAHVSSESAPFLFLHGTDDQVVPYQQSVAMLEKLKEAGLHAEILIAEGAGHTFYNRSPWLKPTLKRMEQFFKKVLR